MEATLSIASVKFGDRGIGQHHVFCLWHPFKIVQSSDQQSSTQLNRKLSFRFQKHQLVSRQKPFENAFVTTLLAFLETNFQFPIHDGGESDDYEMKIDDQNFSEGISIEYPFGAT
jgi:hypothetical protein